MNRNQWHGPSEIARCLLRKYCKANTKQIKMKLLGFIMMFHSFKKPGSWRRTISIGKLTSSFVNEQSKQVTVGEPEEEARSVVENTKTTGDEKKIYYTFCPSISQFVSVHFKNSQNLQKDVEFIAE